MKPGYLLSIPERTVRATAAGAGGVVYEAAEIGLPDWLRGSRVYKAVIGRGLRLVIEGVGGVEGVLPVDDIATSDLFARKAAGNAIELASFLATGWSPLWLLAPAADLAGGTRTYLVALVDELKRKGVLAEDAKVESADELLKALEGTTGRAAEAVDVPPLTAEDFRESWSAFRESLSELPDASRLASLYSQLQEAATQEGRSVAQVSSLIALGALRAGAKMGHEHIFDYYVDSLRIILSQGLGAYVKHALRPYFVAAKGHFDPGQTSRTEQILSRVIRRRGRRRTAV